MHNMVKKWKTRPSRIDTSGNGRQRNDSSSNSKTVSPGGDSASPKGSKDFDERNEQSPLLEPRRSDDSNGTLPNPSPLDSPASAESWSVQDTKEKTKSTWYLFLLTFGGLGLQLGWSVEMSNGSPYLLSLGMSKTLLAFVWLAGPLSGVIVQPIVGMKSDRSRIKWGRRRPFIVGGAIATMVSILFLAWTREIVNGFLSIFGVDTSSHAVGIVIICVAVLFIYVLDFAINVCMWFPSICIRL